MRPLFRKVIVELEQRPDMTKGGIALPETMKEYKVIGRVFAVGPGQWEDGSFVRTIVMPGARVMFRRATMNEIPDDDRKLYVIEEADIIAVLEER